MRVGYYKRIFKAYLGGQKSHLTFWHGTPEVNENAFKEGSSEYYQLFYSKANYEGLLDEDGIPMLDYKGAIGPQYNPIAIAQYGLGNFNLYRKNGSATNLDKAVKAADWLCENLQENPHGLPVWMHKFDWEYFKTLKAPWYSGLAQGQGISLLVRVYRKTGEDKYLEAAKKAFKAMVTPISGGGTLFIDNDGYRWIEEYITEPVTHIVNGFMWALWGVYDLWQLTRDEDAQKLWRQGIRTLAENISVFDTGYWSLYDAAPLKMKNPASSFYHRLHIVQLDVMWRLTGIEVFRDTCEKWKDYLNSRWNTRRALAEKAIFKLAHY
jgi:heparosan-N-sulfate-glucuronate 5-epimerase